MPYLIISTIFCIGALVVVYWIHNQAKLDIITTPAPPPPDGPLISVIIPARNEEKNIQRCVEAVLAQDYPNFEVLVMDDRSIDDTPAILTELSKDETRLVVLFGEELPEGWAGKPHALHQAARSAAGEWLCFVDADTFLGSNTLSAVLHAAEKTDADLYTMMTLQIVETFWEKVVQPIVFSAIATGFSPRKINDPNSRDAIANGQFIFIKRSVYDAIGGHAAVQNQIVEDKAIAEQVKWNGYRLVMADGYSLAKTRMYTSFAALWEGWTKNIYLGLKDSAAMLLLGAFGAFISLFVTLFMPIWPLLGLIGYGQGGGLPALLIFAEAMLVWAAIIYVRAGIAHAMNISRWYALTTPLGTAVFAAMMFTSTWRSLTGKGITWKGRTYDPKKVR